MDARLVHPRQGGRRVRGGVRGLLRRGPLRHASATGSMPCTSRLRALGDRPGRRGHRAGQHLHRHLAGGDLRRGDAGRRRTRTRKPTTSTRIGLEAAVTAADEGDHPGSPVRPAGRHGAASVEWRDEHGLVVIEDAAQAHGARYHGRRAGGLGRRAAASASTPARTWAASATAAPLPLMTTTSPIACVCCGITAAAQKYQHEVAGINSRLDDLQAAFLRVKLARLDEWNQRREQLARRYCQLLAGVPTCACRARISKLRTPGISSSSGTRGAMRCDSTWRPVASKRWFTIRCRRTAPGPIARAAGRAEIYRSPSGWPGKS